MAVFTMICVPETRGRSLAEIQSMYGEVRFIIFYIQPLSMMKFHEQSFKHYGTNSAWGWGRYSSVGDCEWYSCERRNMRYLQHSLSFLGKNKLYLITWVHLASLTLLVELLQKNEPEKSFLNNISPQFSFSDADLISWTATTPQRKCKTEAPEEQKKNSKIVTTQDHSHFNYTQTKPVEGESISFQK